LRNDFVKDIAGLQRVGVARLRHDPTRNEGLKQEGNQNLPHKLAYHCAPWPRHREEKSTKGRITL
jgi:hypothetical protein